MPVLTRSEVEEIVEPHKAVISKCILDAWDDYHKHNPFRHVYRPTTRANVVHDFMVHHAKMAFGGVSGVEPLTVSQMFMLSIEGKVAIRFKKLDEHLRAANYPTQQALGLQNHQYECPDLPPPGTVVVVGYVLSKLKTQIQYIYIVCQNGDKVAWEIELYNRSSATKNMENVANMPQQDTVEQPAKKRVRARGVKKEQGDNGQSSTGTADT